MKDISKMLEDKTGKGHLSYSSIKYALKDLREWEDYMKGNLTKTSQALEFGSMYDTLLFEPHKFDERFKVIDDTHILLEIGGTRPKIRNVYKEWKAEQVKEAGDKSIISLEDHHQAIDMISRLDDCGIRDNFLKGTYQVEFKEEIYISDEYKGVFVKGFLDCLGDGYIADSKSTRSASQGSFARDIIAFSYDIQAFIYSKVFNVPDFIWVVQEKTYPYLPAVYKASDKTLGFGEAKFKKGLTTIIEYLNTDKASNKFYLQGEI
tara:strand:+ start:11330 stop:12118 length:789 start_codon:yes stop_codon:yes gene_type:complete